MSNFVITRMWGYADGTEILFTNHMQYWTASVPPDMEDGQYAVEIHEMDEYGRTCLWTGMLYMNQGKHCLCISEKKFIFWLLPQKLSLAMKNMCSNLKLRHGDMLIEQTPPRYEIKLRRCRKI